MSNSQIMNGVKRGNVNAVRRLLNKSNLGEYAPVRLHFYLREAVEHKHKDLVKMLVNDYNAPLFFPEGGLVSWPIHLAAKAGDVSILRFLLGKGARPNERDDLGRTPLFYARVPSVVRALVGSGASIDATDRDGRTALHEAVLDNTSPVVEELLKHGATVNKKAVGDSERTPLHVACMYGKYDNAYVLVRYGARVNVKNVSGETPLHAACGDHRTRDLQRVRKNKSRFIKMLLERGANPNIPSSVGDTPLHVLCRSEATPEEVEMLLWAGADIWRTNDRGRTPAQEATSPAVRALLRSWPDVVEQYENARVEMLRGLSKGTYRVPPNVRNRIMSHTAFAPQRLKNFVGKINASSRKRTISVNAPRGSKRVRRS